ncbi:alkaline phosphatase family protein [Acidisphaera sp. L21]|uniref:alkaline phosphatase family protein n=1 Tax=Acidisphaera sp. L21 TaxID=1641851 RepID=UPI00131B2F8A|nr:alkaline phosphatase family protein [Acidisphaera sp. L21]
MRRTALLMTTALVVAFATTSRAAPMLTAQPDPTPDVAPFVQAIPAAMPDRDALIQALRQKVKYVFVIFNENHSFDNEFGTFPGANGLYSDGTSPRDAAHTPGFIQHYTAADGSDVTVKPIRLGPEQNSSVIDSVDHSHTGLAAKLHVTGTASAMDQFAQGEYARYAGRGGAANIAMGKQFAQVVMSHIDCDTVPFYWKWASRFTLFDNIFATEDTPSSPNAIAMIAGQSGETQWVKHGTTAPTVTIAGKTGTLQMPPIVNDPQPFWSSQFDTTGDGKQPMGSKTGESYANGNIATNLTFATVPMTLGGKQTAENMAQDRHPEQNQADIKQDLATIASRAGKPVAWRWYQEGYDHEPTDSSATATHDSYVSHHNGAQYFGYLADNPAYRDNLKGLGDFYADMARGDLPVGGGVFYIRGGFTNLLGETPPITNPDYPAALTDADKAAIAKAKSGDDDHPGYSDRQLSETMMARVINAVASKPDIWSQSVILIAYDESDGFYDHVPPRILSFGPDGLPLARGIRVPTLMISPYARAHEVAHPEGDHNAVIETINAIFDLPALASLPDEAQALKAGEDPRFNGPGGFVQHYLGPRDINAPETDDLLAGFEPDRLSGKLPPLPGSLAIIADADMRSLPHYAGQGCRAIGVTPEDARQSVRPAVPAGFNSLPATLPAYNGQ